MNSLTSLGKIPERASLRLDDRRRGRALLKTNMMVIQGHREYVPVNLLEYHSTATPLCAPGPRDVRMDVLSHFSSAFLTAYLNTLSATKSSVHARCEAFEWVIRIH